MATERPRGIVDDILYLLRCAVREETPDIEYVLGLDYEKIWKYSSFHSLEPMIYYALRNCDVSGQDAESVKRYLAWLAKFKESKEKSARKNAMMDIERMQLEAWMEREGIWYVPLKGIILQRLYPGSGLRKMSDNDIWFDKEQKEKVRDYFLRRGYEVEGYGLDHHDTYFKEPIYNFEMHRDLNYEDYNPVWTEYFTKIRNKLSVIEGRGCGLEFSKEDYYLHFVTHAYRHYVNGGIGLKTLTDIYYLWASHEFDIDYLVVELEKLGILEYEEVLRSLTKKVFGEGKAVLSEAEMQMLRRMSDSGAYGTMENSVIYKIGQGNLFSRLKYYWKRISPDEAFLKAYYPFFYRHKWLRPIGNLYRVISGICVHPGKLFREWGYVWRRDRKEK